MSLTYCLGGEAEFCRKKRKNNNNDKDENYFKNKNRSVIAAFFSYKRVIIEIDINSK